MQYMITIKVRALILCFTMLLILLPHSLTGQEFVPYQSHPEYTHLTKQYPNMPETWYRDMVLSIMPEIPSEPPLIMTTQSSDIYAPTAVMAMNQQDSLALVTLYNSTGGDNWTRKEHWLTSKPVANWEGITVDASNRVTRLEFGYNNNLNGTLPPELGNLTALQVLNIGGNTNLSGEIPPEIGGLTSVQFLYLYNNSLTGTIPSEIGNLSNLRYLYLSGNSLSGAIPPEVGKLLSLNLLYLSSNEFTGGIPIQIGNLVNLNTLYLSYNSFTEPIPSELWNLPNLTSLDLSGLEIVFGTIPQEIFSMTNLRYLYLSSNEYTGAIPSDIGKLVNLHGLSFYDNNISEVPPELWTLTNLTYLNFGVNDFSGLIPSEIGQLVNLTTLYLYYNQFSSIPDELWTLTKMRNIDLSGNNLEGVIPSAIRNFTDLSNFTIWGNNFSGELPIELYTLTNLTFLNLSRNEFEGGLQPSIGNLTNLNYLYLHQNQFSGAIPADITKLANLRYLYIYDNNFDDLPDLSGITTLVYLDISRNKFTFDDIVPNIGVPSSAFYYGPQDSVGVSRNILANPGSNWVISGITDNAPNNQWQWYKDNAAVGGATGDSYTINLVEFSHEGTYTYQITNPQAPELTLYSRKIHFNVEYSGLVAGSEALNAIYSSTGGDNWNNRTGWMTNSPVDGWIGITLSDGVIVNLDLTDNNLTGIIPDEIGSLSGLIELQMGYNNLSESIPVGTGNLSNLRLLSLTANQLSGSIPAEFSNLVNLETLLLDKNQFTGPFPEMIMDLPKLKFINLGENLFSGELPENIDRMSGLIELFLDNNQFTGSIPTAIGNMAQLGELSLVGNDLTGSIPASIGNLTNLGYINLSGNRLTGVIPLSIKKLINLNILNLSGNELSENIPAELGLIANLSIIILEYNNFTGEIPDELGDLTDLRVLALGGNKLTGPVPSSLTNLARVGILFLYENQLTDLPNLSSLGSLEEMRVENNRFTFEDIEPNIGITGFVYSPQDSVGDQLDTLVNLETDLDLSISVGGSNNLYQWYKDDDEVPGAIQSTLTIESVAYSDTGRYTCKISNSIATELTLDSRPIYVSVATAPAPLTGGSKKISETSATLYATVNPNGLETQVKFVYGVTTEYGSEVDIQQGLLRGTEELEVSALISGLTPNTTYHYRVESINDFGIGTGSDLQFTTYTPEYKMTHTIAFQTRVNPRDYTENDYRLFGLPGRSNQSLDELLTGNQGKDWEVYWDNGDPSPEKDDYLVRFDGSSRFQCTIGRAFWIIHKGDISLTNYQIPTESMNGVDAVNIPLYHEGWNLITNPFDKPVSWSTVQGANAGLTQPLWRYNGTQTSTMAPCEGYYFDNSDGASGLTIPYPGIGKATIGLAKTTTANDYDWLVQVSLVTDEWVDNTGKFGAHAAAKKTYDRFDLRKPRGFSSYPVLYFAHPDWEGYPLFATDIRQTGSEQYLWEITVSIVDPQVAELSFSGIEQIPDHLSVYLMDPVRYTSVDLRQDSVRSFVPKAQREIFQVMVGCQDEIQEFIDQMAPRDFLMENNFPNPFSESTVIPIQIPTQSNIKIQVFDILGYQVRQLFAGPVEPGIREVQWDGTDDTGRKLPTGIYLCQLTSDTSEKVIRKVVLVK